MPGDERPQPAGIRPVGRALVHHEPGAEQERAADRPRTHHPAEVGEPAQRVAGPQVERVGEVLGGLDREAAVDVDRALRPAGGPRGVDDHVRGLGVGRGDLVVTGRRRVGVAGVGAGSELAGRADRADRLASRPVHRPFHVSAGGHRDGQARRTEAPDDDDRPYRRRGGDRLVGHRLELDRRAAAQEAVGGHEVGRLERGQASGDGRRRVAAEDRAEDGPEPAEREHDDRRLREHRQEDADPAALAHPERRRGVAPPPGPPRRARAQVSRRTSPSSPSQAIASTSGRVRAHGSVAATAWLKAPRRPPARMGRAGREIERRAGRPLPVEGEIVRGRRPEPARIVDGPGLERLEAGGGIGPEPHGPDQPGEPRSGEVGRRRMPRRLAVSPGEGRGALVHDQRVQARRRRGRGRQPLALGAIPARPASEGTDGYDVDPRRPPSTARPPPTAAQESPWRPPRSRPSASPSPTARSTPWPAST